MAKAKLLRDLEQKTIMNELKEAFIKSVCEDNDAIRVLVGNDSKTQLDLETAFKVGLNRYNSWFVERFRKEFEKK